MECDHLGAQADAEKWDICLQAGIDPTIFLLEEGVDFGIKGIEMTAIDDAACN
ncbi:hypothetical protein [Mesorhizobium sp. WSM3868]|uniref:hypothetical protein n=1 Tax=Mesorhizobium sp. WSM3868 TaxID=2029405 RepID=UPI001FDF3461|nr:hypothetical protein [Mesorhizobium sp. WSM3868]